MKVFSLSLVVALAVCVSASAEVTIVGEWVEGLTHTAPAGTDRLLVFIAFAEDDDVLPTVTVTYGGQTMTPVIDESQIEGDIHANVFAFILNEAGIVEAALAESSGAAPEAIVSRSMTILKSSSESTRSEISNGLNRIDNSHRWAYTGEEQARGDRERGHMGNVGSIRVSCGR